MKKIVLPLIWLMSITSVFAVSTQYYAKVPVYFNVPADASFSIAFPSSYSFTSITGTTEAGATTTNWISFNFSSVPQNWVQPQAIGLTSNLQSGSKKPIILIDATGNVNISVSIRFDSALPSGIEVCANATCTPAGYCGTLTTKCTSLDTSYLTLGSDLEDSGSRYLNITLFANVSSGTASGQSLRNLYINGTATS